MNNVFGQHACRRFFEQILSLKTLKLVFRRQAANELHDFLIQELNREANTIGSKADDLEHSQAALAAKGIIEKMREQAQNLE